MRRVYKFLPAHWGSEAIRQRRLKISHFDTLNEPWEFRAIRFSNPDPRRVITEKAAWEKTLNMLGQSRGVICFSNSWSDPVHWSHYADNHRGMALGFDVPDLDGDGNQLALDVNYTDDLLDFPSGFFENRSHQVEKDRFVNKVISTKFSNWAYEKEVRLFSSLEDPDEQTNLFFLDFDASIILKEVIFGYRSEGSDEMTATLARLRKISEIQCWKAGLGTDTFTMVKDPNWTFHRSESVGTE